MQQITICIIAALVTASQGYTLKNTETDQIVVYGFIEDLLNQTIEGIRESIPDPLEIAELEINLPGSPLSGGAKINNLQLVGLNGFQLPVLQFDILKLAANFEFALPKLNLNTKYWADILLADLIPLYGEGKANINLEGLSIKGSGGLNLTNGITKPLLSNLTIVIELGDATFDLHGILNDENFSFIVSSVLNDAIAPFINDNKDVITIYVSPVIEAVLNILLQSIFGSPENKELVLKLEKAYAEHQYAAGNFM